MPVAILTIKIQWKKPYWNSCRTLHYIETYSHWRKAQDRGRNSLTHGDARVLKAFPKTTPAFWKPSEHGLKNQTHWEHTCENSPIWPICHMRGQKREIHCLSRYAGSAQYHRPTMSKELWRRKRQCPSPSIYVPGQWLSLTAFHTWKTVRNTGLGLLKLKDWSISFRVQVGPQDRSTYPHSFTKKTPQDFRYTQ